MKIPEEVNDRPLGLKITGDEAIHRMLDACPASTGGRNRVPDGPHHEEIFLQRFRDMALNGGYPKENLDRLQWVLQDKSRETKFLKRLNREITPDEAPFKNIENLFSVLKKNPIEHPELDILVGYISGVVNQCTLMQKYEGSSKLPPNITILSYNKNKTGWGNVAEISDATTKFDEEAASWGKDIDTLIQEKKHSLFFKIAYLEDKPVGYALAYGVGTDYAKLEFLLVSPEYHGRHIGQALMTELVRKVQKSGYEILKFKFRRQSKNFYTKFFRKISFEFQIREFPPTITIGPMGGEMMVKMNPQP